MVCAWLARSANEKRDGGVVGFRLKILRSQIGALKGRCKEVGSRGWRLDQDI